jgi:uncharacterized protein YaiI (UPF0178 family)
MTIKIYIDGDACPVKDETYKVAARYGLRTFVVSNSFMQIPRSPLIARIIVDAGADVADDWITEQVVAGDVVVTSDIPLAGRVLAKEAHAIAPYGRAFTQDSIGSCSRAALAHGAYPLDGRNHRRPTGIFIRQPIAIPSSLGPGHRPRAKTAAMSRSALPAESCGDKPRRPS